MLSYSKFKKLDNGSFHCEIKEEDFHPLEFSEDVLREQFEHSKQVNSEPWEVEDQDDEAKFDRELYNEWETRHYKSNDVLLKVLEDELNVFKNTEEYSYIADLHSAYKSSLQKTLASKIIETIPDHYFWDIKTPKRKESIIPKNEVNPYRHLSATNFFEQRDEEMYMDKRNKSLNIDNSQSIYRRY